jgi:hypothetical protein
MGLQVEHEIHRRRFGRNMGVGVLLAAFVVLMLALTVVKVTRGGLAPHAMDGQGNMSNSVPIAPAAKVSP